MPGQSSTLSWDFVDDCHVEGQSWGMGGLCANWGAFRKVPNDACQGEVEGRLAVPTHSNCSKAPGTEGVTSSDVPSLGGSLGENGYMYMYMRESLCCPPGPITTLLICYTPVQKNKTKKTRCQFRELVVAFSFQPVCKWMRSGFFKYVWNHRPRSPRCL